MAACCIAREEGSGEVMAAAGTVAVWTPPLRRKVEPVPGDDAGVLLVP
jgi:hypothetical protein